jgi:Cu(I)/Ag(I) efflux system membrane protein CusA/SilA
MIGGMITAPLLSLFVLPAVYKLLGFRRFVVPAGGEQDDRSSPAIPVTERRVV